MFWKRKKSEESPKAEKKSVSHEKPHKTVEHKPAQAHTPPKSEHSPRILTAEGWKRLMMKKK